MGKRCISHNTHTYFLAHTLFAGFSVLLAAGSGCSCLPFLDGVLLILGEWNLSISFMVKEDRWDRCESVDRGRTEEVEWSVEEERFSGRRGEKLDKNRWYKHTEVLISLSHTMPLI